MNHDAIVFDLDGSCGYDYARDFGGVAYLFLRGMSPRHAPGCGVFFDRPSSALVSDLSELVGVTRAEAPR